MDIVCSQPVLKIKISNTSKNQPQGSNELCNNIPSGVNEKGKTILKYQEILVESLNYFNNHKLLQGIEYLTPKEAYFGLNQDDSQKLQKVKLYSTNQGERYWTKSREL